MEYLIRHLNDTDYDDILALWSRCGLDHKPAGRDSREAMGHEFTRADSCFLGMFEGGKMIGVIIGSSDGRKGWINRLAVHPEYRGRGLAAELIRRCEEFLHGLGLKVTAALIEDWNTPSISAFAKSGYEFAREVLYCSKRTSADD